MLRWYGYLGLALIALAQINFLARIEPFATWYIPIVWYGYILFVDSLVYRVKKRSLISSYPKEFIFLLVLSVPFWSIFEVYNLFTSSWYYVNYVWYVHFADFTTIMPAVLETFSLFTVLGLGKRFDKRIKSPELAKRQRSSSSASSLNAVRLLAVLGAFAAIMPVLVPAIGFPFIWLGLFLFLDPLNYLTGRQSVVRRASSGRRSIVLRLFLAGITMGFFWEFWNYQAYPKWFYSIPYLTYNTRLFEMPVFGYLGYLGFALEVFVFYSFFRYFVFKGSNDLLDL
jgi:hypothetical protein